MCSGRKIVIRIGSFPFLKGSTRFRKFSLISDSPKRHWISAPASFSFVAFDPKNKTNFERQTLYRAPIPVTPSDSRIRKYPILELFLWAYYLTKQRSLLNLRRWFSSRDLCKTPLVRELFKPVEFGSRFSSGFKAQSSSEERIINLKIPSFSGCYFTKSSALVECWLGECYVPIKWSSIKTILLLVVSSFWWLSSWEIPSFPCFAFFGGGELFESLDSCVKFPTVSFCSMMLSMRKVLCEKLVATSLNSSEN